MKKTYLKPETTLHRLYVDSVLAVSTKDEGVSETPEGGDVNTDENGEAWGDSHRRDFNTSW